MRHPRRHYVIGLGIATLAGWTACGCARLSAAQLRLGYYVREPGRVLPEGKSRASNVGLCYLDHDLFGRTEAIVIFLSRDRRIAGKFQATLAETNVGFKPATTFALEGELDPTVAHLAGAGPIDTLRAIADDLTQPETDALVREAQDWVAAGIVRLVQRWPHAGDEGPAAAALTAMLERVPADGEATIVVHSDGALSITYAQTVPR
jgi:hypothetical protein